MTGALAEAGLVAAVVGGLVGGMAAVRALGTRLGWHPEVSRKAIHVGTGLVAMSFPALFPDRWPVAVLGCTVVLECVWLGLVPLEPPVQFNSAPVAVMLAGWEVGVRHGWKVAWAAGAVAAQTVLVAGEITRGDQVLAANIFALDLVLAATGAGVLVASRHRRLQAAEQRAITAEHDREAEARRQVAAERFRMARELHDVVAHHLTLVNAQAGVAAYLVRTDTEAAASALDGIADNTRQALDELRATVGLLRHYDADRAAEVGDDVALAPMPGLASVATLLDAHRTAGMDLTDEVNGQAVALPAVSDLAAYRILQESLTNARKHAPGARVVVGLTWAEQLTVTVINGPHPGGPTAPAGPGTGHGLLGMRERAAAVGGSFAAAPTTDGGYRVHVTIPRLTNPDEEGRR